MKLIKEVNVFTNGDSSKISTWSNMPFFLTETLLSKGIKVNRVDLSASRILISVFNKSFYRVIKFIFKDTTFDYYRSHTHFLHSRYRISKASNQFPNADANIFLSFSYSAKGLSNLPSIFICDWTYDYYLKYFKNKKPDYLEAHAIKKEDQQIFSSDLLVILFRSINDYMNARYNDNKTIHLGNYVINSLHKVKEDDMLKGKYLSFNILFVGNQFYLEGLINLIEAFKLIKIEFPKAKLHIVGLDSSNFSEVPNDVNFHGFLDKGDQTQNEFFQELYRTAKVFVNTTPKWGGFSSTIEAMYSYVPVIVAPYDEFVQTFGQNINFGYYCEDNNPTKIAELIRAVFLNPNYNDLCVSSHTAVIDFTWDVWVDKLLLEINKLSDN